MKQFFPDYAKSYFHNLYEAIVNIFIFLPYFFSVGTFFKTLFSPWKNIRSTKTQIGFTFSDYFDRLGFDLVSRGMGFFMRSSIILFYLIFQIILLISLPFVIVASVILLPFFYTVSLLTKSEDQKKQLLKTAFIKAHLLNDSNYTIVESWFQEYYLRNYYRSKWWKLENLAAVPPMGRDWSAGFTPSLDQVSEDLADPSYQQNMKHVVDRVKEVEQIERILSKTDEANVVIVGDEGVGKHTIVDAFAKKLYEGKTTPVLMYKRILKLNMQRILTQYSDQSKREEFLETLFREAAEAKNVILFIENLDKYVSNSQGRVDLTIPIEKYAKTDKVQIIGTSSPFLYQEFIFRNDKINRIFSKLDAYEISKEQALQILLDTVESFEKRYQVAIPFETLQLVIEKSDFYITAIPFPEKAMQLLDMACVYTTQTLNQSQVLPAVIDTVISEKTHVPSTLSDELKQKLLQIESLLTQRIINQPEAISEISSSLRRSFILLGKRKKPLASVLFLGPTGVGKTETAKAISEVFFGKPQGDSSSSFLRFDMSAYQMRENIPQLIGSIETGNPGLLTSAVREHPYGVLLLDELEKADKNLLNIFLTILDEGYYTDGFGKRVDCKNLIIIATSNAGAELFYLNSTSSPTQTSLTQLDLVNHLIQSHIYTPEFLNRFDGIIMYRPLQSEGATQLAKKMLMSITEQLKSIYHINISVTDNTLNTIVSKSYDPAFGARDMERVLRKEIEDNIAKMILANQIKEGDSIQL